MIYDRMREMISRYSPNLLQLVDSAVVIHYPVVSHKVLGREVVQGRDAYVNTRFRLPYRVVAVEDNASCCLLADMYEGAPSCPAGLVFIDCVPGDSTTNEDNYADLIDNKIRIREICQQSEAGSTAVGVGSFKAMMEGKTWQMVGTMTRMIMGTPNHAIVIDDEAHRIPGNIYTQMLQACTRNAVTAVDEVLHVAGLPKFEGWPEVNVGRRFFKVHMDGEIEAVRTEQL